MNGDYKHYGTPEPGVWGGMSVPVGARTDMAVQRTREAMAGLLSLLTPWEWDVPPSNERVAARVRARS